MAVLTGARKTERHEARCSLQTKRPRREFMSGETRDKWVEEVAMGLTVRTLTVPQVGYRSTIAAICCHWHEALSVQHRLCRSIDSLAL